MNFQSQESAVRLGEKRLNRLLRWWNPLEKGRISRNDWHLIVLGVCANGWFLEGESLSLGWFLLHRFHSSQRSTEEAKNVLSTLITAMTTGTFCRHFVSMNCLLTKWKTIRNVQASGNALSPVCGKAQKGRRWNRNTCGLSALPSACKGKNY